MKPSPRFLKMFCIAIILFNLINLTENWRTDRRPRVFGDKVPDQMLSPDLKNVQRKLVILHDYFRTKVIPPASNMLNMKWHNGAAKTAQKWATACKFLIHDSIKGRHQKNFGTCGQNIFVSTHKVPWMFVMKSWFIERKNFTFGSPNNSLGEIGHYTQMVWATSHKVGCGLAKCKNGPNGRTFYNYVCNYCPTGNYLDKFWFPYKIGRPCASCRNHCHKNGKLCTNSCQTVDLWSNCGELFKTFRSWLCHTATAEGLDRRKKCAATCGCKGKIYDGM
ncbi:cysteine-rich secretory protein 2-like [Condylostylus longicornis]|uniref:cysteine-rich secretory protein 2-like n=1 Tax=Condylostylus longicornis TaxID=2530218 RepID=UPI00244E32AF|nr:cysteine-rich secretory protein 2-like [Condylostylus longicornis]